MKKQTFKSWISEWNEGDYDFTEKTIGELHPDTSEHSHDEYSGWSGKTIGKLYEREVSFFKTLFPIMGVILTLIFIFFFMEAVITMPAFGSAQSPASVGSVSKRYIEKGLTETGAINIVAGVILDYRAFDTLGESHVLFTASIVVFSLLLQTKADKEDKRERYILQHDLILKKTAQALIPLIIMFGMYVILNGHLGPGGGFSGGAIIGSGFILYSLAYGSEKLSSVISMKTYRGVVSCSLLFYSLAKCYSFFCGANGYHTIFSPGTPGKIFSAGLILPLNFAVGMVVACTIYGFYSIFKQGRL